MSVKATDLLTEPFSFLMFFLSTNVDGFVVIIIRKLTAIAGMIHSDIKSFKCTTGHMLHIN